MLYFKAYLSVKTIAFHGKHAKIRIVLTSDIGLLFKSRYDRHRQKHKALDISTALRQTLFSIETLSPFAFV